MAAADAAAGQRRPARHAVRTTGDPDPLNPPPVPVELDLLFTLKAGRQTDFYFFDDLILAGSNNGTYTVSILNPPGNAFKNLSDISLLARNLREVPSCLPRTPECTPAHCRSLRQRHWPDSRWRWRPRSEFDDAAAPRVGPTPPHSTAR